MKPTIGVTTLAVAGVLLAGASLASAAELKMMTGPQGGSWIPLGGQLKDMWEKAIPGLSVQSLPGAGIANVRGIDEGKAQIAQALDSFYQSKYPDLHKNKKALVDSSIKTVQEIYLRNIFPEMKITWGTHPNHIGHEESAGCFRCHDGSHNSADGRTIAADCTTCHTILAQDERDPKILKDLSPK